MNMETAEKLPKHLNTAVNAIQKQIDKYDTQIGKLITKRMEIQATIDSLNEETEGLKEQIAKLKGE